LKKFSIIPDKIEVGTLLCAGIITGGTVVVKGVMIDHIKPFLKKLSEMNVKFKILKNGVKVLPSKNLKPIKIISGLKRPCIDADFEPILVPVLCTIDGKSIIQDTINPQRHSKFIPQLNAMGANIIEVNETDATINGCTEFKTRRVRSNDIRGGMSLILAALTIKDKTIINNIFQIDRGYEKIEKKLQLIGANIKRKNIRRKI